MLVQVATTLPSGVDTISNMVAIGDDGTNGAEPTPADNVFMLIVPVNAAPELVISKTDGVTASGAGDMLHYTISFTNTGTQDAVNMIITDTLPANTMCGFACLNWNLVSGNTYTRSIPLLPAGQSGTVDIYAQVNNPVPAGANTLVNQVCIV